MLRCGYCRLKCKVDPTKHLVPSWTADCSEPEEPGTSKQKVQYVSIDDFKKRDTLIDRSQLHLQDVEFRPAYELESDSVYGAVIAIPQIARTVGWNKTMVALTFRCFLLLLLNYLLQASAIIYIGQESQVMDVLSGKMHLCDFAYDLEECPDHNHCTGPGGTPYTPTSLYRFDIWSIRTYMRDSVKNALKGTKYEDSIPHVDKVFDPGEHGMENYWCRYLACFIFMINEVQEIFKATSLSMLLVKLPNKGESWVRTRKHEAAKANPLSNSKFVIAGIPVCWKIFYVLIVVIPKWFLCYNVCWMGMRFLMETAGIIDVVLGAMTMDFILTLDELIYAALGSCATKHMMDELESFSVGLSGGEDSVDSEHNMTSSIRWGAAKLTLPRRLLITTAAFFVFAVRYYLLNCDFVDGMWVSKPMYLPLSSYYDFENFLTGHVRTEKEPFWTMPGDHDL